MRNLVYVVIDSARYDTFLEAGVQNIRNLGTVERRYSFASWTSPSHLVYLMGMTPHTNPRGVLASEVYKTDYVAWSERLRMPGVSMKDFLPAFSLPEFLKSKEYTTHAMVSMPIINGQTVLSRGFDSYELMPRHDDFGSIIDRMTFHASRPAFYFLNVGEAHYPYMIPPEDLPTITGQDGVIVRHGDPAPGVEPREYYFNLRHLKRFRECQIAAIETVDRLMARLVAKCPAETFVIVTSDHGELFGEDGFFGHGPIVHQKVFEVPFVEGALGR